MAMRVLFTGGTGKAGRHALPCLHDRGHRLLNFDLQPFDHPAFPTLLGDVTDGAQVLNAVSDTITADGSTAAFLARRCPGIPVVRELAGQEAPLSNRKARDVLGFEERHNWRDEVRALGSAKA